MPSAPSLNWHSLELFASRFRANVDALGKRDADLACRLAGFSPNAPLMIAAQGDDVFLGRQTGSGIDVIPNPVSPDAARRMIASMYPTGHVTAPLVVGGLGYGWLWDRLSRLQCQVAAAPGHRPPVYFLTAEIERLWAVLHVLDWTHLLSDARFPIFVGPDAAEQLKRALIDDPSLPRAAACVRVEPALWSGKEYAALYAEVDAVSAERLQALEAQLADAYPALPPARWADRLRSGSLRILGVTSRYTTFLQYSMRDWLAGFERLGHTTRLLIEPADHLGPSGQVYARTILDFRPDVIVLIDHYRAESAIIPRNLPCVMWVQDRLPNIYTPDAGPKQSRLDYVLGYGWLECTRDLNYPATRFMSAPIGVNDARFVPSGSLDAFACDVAFVSHASAPAERIVKDAVAQQADARLKRLVSDAFERLRAAYESGDAVTETLRLKAVLTDSAAALGLEVPDAEIAGLMPLFSERINNALFRHQSLGWAAEAGIDLRLYGNGWESHPRLGGFARGPAANADLPKIYAGSRINLQVTPYGGAHQRLFEGLCAGGFFLLRHTDGESYDRTSRRIWRWCESRGITTGRQLIAQATAQIASMLNELSVLTGWHPSLDPDRYLSGIADAAAGGFVRSASTLFEQYDAVSFRSREGLQKRISHFLKNADERKDLAEQMRRRVLETLTYRAISERLIGFMANDLAGEALAVAA